MRGLRTAFLLAMPLAVAVACSSTTKARGQLMVSVQTDLSIPKDIDSIGLFVYSGGTGLNLQEYQVGEASQQLPATFGIIQGSSPDEPVRIRLTGRKNGALLLLSEVITTVPSGRLALLRMPLQWLCLGEANDGTDTSSPPESLDGSATSKCTVSEEMCVAGRCADENIDSSTLPDYDPTQVFGGASGPGENGTCLDTLGCFSTGSIATVDTSGCTIAAPSGGAGVNVALVLPPGGPGICDPAACLVPLDQASGYGWSTTGGAIQLPKGVCDELAAKDFLGVAVTTSCATKTAAMPACGSWDSASGNVGTADAAAPEGTPSSVPGQDGGNESLDGSADASDGGSSPNDAGQDSGPLCAAFSVNESVCNPVKQTGCSGTESACAASATSDATSCVTPGSTGAGGACATSVTCGPGLYCLQNQCMQYCCTSADCTLVDGGFPQCSQQAGANNTFFGVCESF